MMADYDARTDPDAPGYDVANDPRSGPEKFPNDPDMWTEDEWADKYRQQMGAEPDEDVGQDTAESLAAMRKFNLEHQAHLDALSREGEEQWALQKATAPAPAYGGTLYPDGNRDNADWTKRSWDIPARTLEELRTYLGNDPTQIEAFKHLPVYRWNVDKPGMEWLRDL